MKGWHRQWWNTQQVENGVEFSYLSPDGDDRYPGEVLCKTTYTLEGQTLRINMQASLLSGGPTPIRLTNHTYFNLDGHKCEVGINTHSL